MSAPRTGRVLLVGAGPGDPDLITVRGAEALRRADAVVYDSLAAPELLDLAPAQALRIDVGKRGHDAPTRSQEDVNALLVRLAREGRTVVRLKGGDPFVFGRGGEEASACAAAGIPFEVVPGVSAALAVPAAAGIPVTDRRHSASFAVVTGHRDATRPWTSIRWDRLATATDTLVVLMGMRNLGKIVQMLVDHGRDPATPAAVVMEGATPRQRTVVAPLAELPGRVREAGLRAPAVVVVGDVVRLRSELAWLERKPLFGWRVLVGRAADQAGELAARLREAGALPVCIPMIQTQTVEGAPLEAAVAALRDADVVIFTSANAARHLAEALARRGVAPDEVGARIVCVGPATARAASAAGFRDGWVPQRGRHDAESLAEALAAEGALAGRRVLLPTAEGAGAALAERLRAAGARVDVVPVYRTVPAEVDAGALRASLLEGRLDALTFTSPSTVSRFASLLDAPAHEAARRCVVVAIGQPTARALREAGLPADVVPERAGAAEMVLALVAHAARTPRRSP